METKPIPSAPASEIGAFLLCGSLLILVGAAVLCFFSFVVFENFWRLGGSVESERTSYLYAGLVVAPIVAIGLSIAGFYVAKRKSMPFWYVFVTGFIPGFLLFQGWAAVQAGLAARKGLQVSGLRRVIIITAVVGLFLAVGLYSLFAQ